MNLFEIQNRASACPPTLNVSVLFGLLFLVSACTFTPPPAPDLPSRATLRPGETVTVRGNENIYLLAHEHNVSMRELIVLNDMKPPYAVRRGQKLVLPVPGVYNEMAPPEASPLEPVESAEIAPIGPVEVTSQVLEPPVTKQELAPPPSTNNLKVSPTPLAPHDAVQTLNTPSPVQKQAATTLADDSADNALSMRWPVQGPILSSFGSKGAGMNNDGINIGAPKGSAIVAAAPGMVVYAGNDMKGFGNLVLIRHRGDVITAYAHLERVLVKKDTIVGQGDMIGTVGKTGNVSSPQLHFEIRQDGKPVDPAVVIKTAL